jgi:hypothetical protein
MTTQRRYSLLHPALVKMSEDNAQLLARNLTRAEEIAQLKAKICLLEEQRRTALFRVSDCLNFLHDLRNDIRAANGTSINEQLDRSIQSFIGDSHL